METNNKYTWDTTKFCTNQAEFDERVTKITSLVSQIAKYKGKLGQKESLREYLMLDDQLSDMLEAPFMWAHCATDVDVTDAKQNANQHKLEVLSSQIGQEQSFATPEILSQPDSFFDDIINDDQFLPWRQTFRILKQQKKHVLNDEQQKIVSALSPIMESFTKTFSSCVYGDIKFGKIMDSKGVEHELTNTNYQFVLEDPDRTLRKNATERYFEVHGHYLNTLTANLNAQVQRNTIMAKLYHYPTVFDSASSGLNIDRAFYDKFMVNVQPFFKLYKRFNDLRLKTIAKQYGIKDLKEYDAGLPIGKKLENISFEQALEKVKNALSILGKDYITQIERAVNERWIDVYPSANKFSGGYSSSIHGYSPVILLNWENSLDDVYTLAHELGHAIRHVYCGETGYREAPQTAMFVDETFSTTNQVLLYRYLVENEKNKDAKIYILSEYISNLLHYLSSVLDSKCEDYLYTKMLQNTPASKDEILEYTKSVYACIQSDIISERHSSVRTLVMFHYYSLPYYVWQYTCGILNANFIANNILKGDSAYVDKYLQFLSSGSMYPLDALKIVDIDYNTQDVFDAMRAELNMRIDQLEKLLNE